ncbi:succinate dehydrogenase, cytochrome b556 subunit [Aquabacterium sp.]|uniref:succinate dehydrogenase, cytochrome b556 subunit n=1 Tax=Aquabacterium sp. TaxID=1872578 RepID=UPI0040377B17
MADNAKTPRPVFRNIHVTDIVSYRLPPAGIVSILHRISGAIMFLLMPFIIWMFDTSVSTEISYDQFTAVFSAGCADGLIPGWFFKLIALGLIWAYLVHFIAGVRHLIMDATHRVSKEQGHSTAVVTLALSSGLTVVLAAKLFGLF